MASTSPVEVGVDKGLELQEALVGLLLEKW